MSHHPPWRPGALLFNGYYDVYLDIEAIQFEPITLQARYMAVVQMTDEILEDMCQAGVDGNHRAC